MKSRLCVSLAVLTGSVTLVALVALLFDLEILGQGSVTPLALDPPPRDPSESASVALGRVVPDYVLQDLAGRPVRPDALRDQIPTVVEIGSFTCKYCTQQSALLDELAEKYRGRVRFLFVYSEEAHPDPPYFAGDYDGDRKPFHPNPTQSDRIAAAQIFRKSLGVQREVLIENVAQDGLRQRCNLRSWMWHPGIVVDREGRIVYAAKWLKADYLDKFLSEYLANPDKATPAFDDTVP